MLSRLVVVAQTSHYWGERNLRPLEARGELIAWAVWATATVSSQYFSMGNVSMRRSYAMWSFQVTQNYDIKIV